MNRFDVYTVSLDPTLGVEIKKTRPCVIISPDEMNQYIGTVIIAPMTTSKKMYKSRVNIKFQGKDNQIVLDQIRAVDKQRLLKQIGKITEKDSILVCNTLIQMFTY
ncbi:MAG: type II toxin-antitoxin system PemK/MazF family toxin [Candidatus Aminicenantes bacterium]|jgi:mRNA interferase MazF